MTEENIFVNKLLFSLNISDFSLSLCKNCTPHHHPEKSHSYLPSNPHLKIVFMSSLPSPIFFFENLVGDSTLQQKWRGSHYVFLTYSTWFLGFNCVLLIIKIAGLETSRPTFLGGKFGIISWNRLIIFNGDMKCVLLISFLVQNLITSDNPISMWLRWIWNSAFWLEVENLIKLETIVFYKLIPNLSQENRKTLPSALIDTSTT